MIGYQGVCVRHEYISFPMSLGKLLKDNIVVVYHGNCIINKEVQYIE